eukprot:scaffold40584_cov237-Amphora_coffeaeformis.AAC.2
MAAKLYAKLNLDSNVGSAVPVPAVSSSWSISSSSVSVLVMMVQKRLTKYGLALIKAFHGISTPTPNKPKMA